MTNPRRRARVARRISASARTDVPAFIPVAVSIDPEPVNPYRAAIEEFGAAILERRPPSNDVSLGVRAQRVIAACYQSARDGRAVRVT